ncbi:SDR family NAD(P)-dependent oxidoreductase [Bacillus sp. FJAT-29814]|uniref:SDR family NAD(P)-dependent oxidoreductase n=1 Tax=Bacillus sp. FJAT-29814 TaxID=1729688 RepID=UPI00083209D8|nr:SDR family oxidoreductase [Bacillus sp. FJAT-29814]
MLSFKNKVVWVTGSTTGIGKATIQAFAKLGANVVIHGFNDRKNGEDIAVQLEDAGTRVLLVDGDVTVKRDVEEIVGMIKDKFGRIDILVNNVGAFIKKANIEELEEEDWDRIMDVNLKSVFLVTKAALPLLKTGENSRIINITSGVVRTGGTKLDLAYTAAKGGVDAMTRALAKKLIDYNIQVNGVAPGLIDTPFHNSEVPLSTHEGILKNIPMQRAGLPEDIAGAVLFLASEHANYITGEIIEVSGGRRIS